MREMKFRAFIKNELGGFYIDEDSDCFIVSNGDGFGVYDEYKNLLPDNRIVIEQFTGSRDRNNNDIYEGDIIDFDKEEWGGEDHIHVVSWNEKEAGWCFGGGSVNDMEWRTVIGNIHENKDLLP